MFRVKHPPGLYILFFTEMWERFSFYCMAAVFMLYMTWEGNGHPFLQENASLINGLYIGTVYFTPFFGGWWADRQLGYRWAVVLGAIVMGLGHLLLAVDQLSFFFGGLACLVIGNGLFKPNISTLVGKLYPANDERLDSAYTIFYMGINIGAFISPLVAGYLRVRYGFHVAFGAAGVGMGISLVIFLLCQRFLVFERLQIGVVNTPLVADEEIPADVQRARHQSLLIIFVIVALFWMAFKQNANTLALWFRDCTDRSAPTWLPESWVQPGSPLVDDKGWITTEYASSINPFFVIAFSPLLVWFWGRLRRADLEPSTPAKIGLGMLLAATGFAVLGLGAWTREANNDMPVSPGYLLGAYAIITLGELSLSPIGLSLVSKLAAKSQRSAWMGGWFGATAVGGYLSGIIGQFWKTWNHSTFFFVLTLTSLGAFGILVLFYQRLQASMPVTRPSTPPSTELPRPVVVSTGSTSP